MGREIKRVPLDYQWDGEETDPPEGEGWMIWETVSEGTPVTEVFKTKEEAVEYLHHYGATGTFEPCSRAAALDFLEKGWAPSMILVSLGGVSPQFGVADGISVFSFLIHPLLAGFDALSDDILDSLQRGSKKVLPPKALTRKVKLDAFRVRLDNYLKWSASTGKVTAIAKKHQETLPEEVQTALQENEKVKEEIYGQKD